MKTLKKYVVQPEGNYYDKYNSTNPIVKWMMKHFFSDLDSLLNGQTPHKILEAGCGEGKVTGRLSKKFGEQCEIQAFDISEKVIAEAKEHNPKISFSVGNIYDIDAEDETFDLVVCCEVLEHLEKPEKALKELKRVISVKGYGVISVPREPLWRVLNMARGKYIKDLGNTPGHIQHWSSKKFVKFIGENGFEVLGVKKPIPWTMVLVKRGKK